MVVEVRSIPGLRVPSPTTAAVSGTVGSTLLAIGGAHTGAVLASGGPIGYTAPITSIWWFVAAYAGLAILLASWAAVGWSLATKSISLRWLIVTMSVWAIPLALTAPLFSRDVYSYIAQGQLSLRGFDPYSVGPRSLGVGTQYVNNVSKIWRTTAAPYGPMAIDLFKLADLIAHGHLWIAIGALRLEAILGVVLMGFAVPRLAQRFGVRADRAFWGAVMNPLLLMHFIGGTHNDALMTGLLLLGLWLALEHRQVILAIVIVTAAAAIKAPAGAALPFLALIWSTQLTGAWRRTRACIITGAIGLAGFTAITYLSRLSFGWISHLGDSSRVHYWLSVSTFFGQVLGGLHRAFVTGVSSNHVVIFGDSGATTAALNIVRDLGTLASLVVVIYMFFRASAKAEQESYVVQSLGIALLALVVLAPVVYPWYFLWAIPLIAVTAKSDRVHSLMAAGTIFLCTTELLHGAHSPTYVPLVVLCVLAVIMRRQLTRQTAAA